MGQRCRRFRRSRCSPAGPSCSGGGGGAAVGGGGGAGDRHRRDRQDHRGDRYAHRHHGIRHRLVGVGRGSALIRPAGQWRWPWTRRRPRTVGVGVGWPGCWASWPGGTAGCWSSTAPRTPRPVPVVAGGAGPGADPPATRPGAGSPPPSGCGSSPGRVDHPAACGWSPTSAGMRRIRWPAVGDLPLAVGGGVTGDTGLTVDSICGCWPSGPRTCWTTTRRGLPAVGGGVVGSGVRPARRRRSDRAGPADGGGVVARPVPLSLLTDHPDALPVAAARDHPLLLARCRSPAPAGMATVSPASSCGSRRAAARRSQASEITAAARWAATVSACSKAAPGDLRNDLSRWPPWNGCSRISWPPAA